MNVGIWNPPDVKPTTPGVYPVEVPIYSVLRHDVVDGSRRRYARWTGEFWCCWAPDPKRAAMCQWRGPSAGYCWFDSR